MQRTTGNVETTTTQGRRRPAERGPRAEGISTGGGGAMGRGWCPVEASAAASAMTERRSRAAAGAPPVTVLKFGSSVLAGEEDAARAVHEIYRYHRAGHGVVAVVSALAGATERLLAQARRWGGEAAPRGVAALLATGEATAAALLLLALDRAGLPAALLDPRQAALRAGGPLLDGEPCGVNVGLLRRWLARHRVVVVPGFYGEAADGAVALFGRGGSDLTALFLAHRLGAAECRLLKDVDGLYESDPAAAAARPPDRFEALSWRAAARLGGRIVQGKALAFAARHRIAFRVASPAGGRATEVGPGPARLEHVANRPETDVRPLRVALLGLGTVGGGVYHHLAAEPRRFTVVGVAVRDPGRRREGVPPALVTGDPWQLLRQPCDLVVEVMGGTDPAARLIAAALAAGRDVVTANKAVMAAEGRWLARHAAAHGAVLRCAAAVGGAVPVLEAVTRAAAAGEVLAIRGVLNGTCNFVLDQMAAGSERGAAVRLAQERGFAEADPARDLDGRDAACKLRLLARAAFGVDLGEDDVERAGIDGLAGIDPDSLAAWRRRGRVVRLVAECRGDGSRVQAAVRPVVLAARHFLAGARGEENRVVIERRGAPPLRLRGLGAGRWPTSEAVLADLFAIARCRLDGRPGDAPEMSGAAPGEWDGAAVRS
jgi:homoserine dehydrogenase